MSVAHNCNHSTVSDQLLSIEKQRDTLKRALKITRSFEHLQNGLSAAHSMGSDKAAISEHALQMFENLTAKTTHLPTNKLQMLVSTLDRVVSEKLSTILAITKSAPFSEPLESLDLTLSGDLDESINALLTEFRRKAQTAVALRVLLNERGVQVKPISSNIKESELVAKINFLDKKQKKCRNIVTKQIVGLHSDIGILLSDDTLTDGARESMMRVRHGLKVDLDHIAAGKQLESMPSFVEVIELRDDIPKAAVKKLESEGSANDDVVVADSITIDVDTNTEKSEINFFARFWRRLWK